MDDATKSTPVPPPQKPQTSNRSNLIKIIVGAIIIAVICIIAALSCSPSDTFTIATDQLEAIKKGNLESAYNLNSTKFKEATSFEVFESYVNSNPILNNYKAANFSDNKVTGDTAYLKGVVTGTDGGQMRAEYQLVKEGNHWKIEALRLSPIGTEAREAPMQTTHNDNNAVNMSPKIHGVMTSDVADNDGYVEETKTVLSRSAPKIFVTTMLVSPTPDITVSAVLKHLPTGVTLGPVESKTTKTGNIMKAFSFTREKQLWPAGEYEIVTSLSTGDTQTLKFEVK